MTKPKTSSRHPRYPLRMDPETKRRLAVLSADAGKKNEDFGAQVFSDAIEKLYLEYSRRIARESR